MGSFETIILGLSDAPMSRRQVLQTGASAALGLILPSSAAPLTETLAPATTASTNPLLSLVTKLGQPIRTNLQALERRTETAQDAYKDLCVNDSGLEIRHDNKALDEEIGRGNQLRLEKFPDFAPRKKSKLAPGFATEYRIDEKPLPVSLFFSRVKREVEARETAAINIQSLETRFHKGFNFTKLVTQFTNQETDLLALQDLYSKFCKFPIQEKYDMKAQLKGEGIDCRNLLDLILGEDDSRGL